MFFLNNINDFKFFKRKKNNRSFNLFNKNKFKKLMYLNDYYK